MAEKYICNCSPTISLHLSDAMKQRFLADARPIIRAIPLKEVKSARATTHREHPESISGAGIS
jgi:hypothetical protein